MQIVPYMNIAYALLYVVLVEICWIHDDPQEFKKSLGADSLDCLEYQEAKNSHAAKII